MLCTGVWRFYLLVIGPDIRNHDRLAVCTQGVFEQVCQLRASARCRDEGYKWFRSLELGAVDV